MLCDSGRGLVIALVGALWVSGSSEQPIERRKHRDSRQSAGNAGNAKPAPVRRDRRRSAGNAGIANRAPGSPDQPLERQKLSSTTPEERCVGIPVAPHQLLWGVFIYNNKTTDLRVLL